MIGRIFRGLFSVVSVLAFFNGLNFLLMATLSAERRAPTEIVIAQTLLSIAWILVALFIHIGVSTSDIAEIVNDRMGGEVFTIRKALIRIGKILTQQEKP